MYILPIGTQKGMSNKALHSTIYVPIVNTLGTKWTQV